MIYLLLFFVFMQLTVLARYIVYGAFEPMTYASTYLLIVAAFCIFMFSKRAAKKEAQFQPEGIAGWSCLIKQRSFANEKPLFFAEQQRGTIQRVFQKRWHAVIADTFGESFFLALRIVIDNNVWDITPVRTRKINNQQWHIVCNGVHVGEATTLINWQHTKKLTEAMALHLHNDTYTSTASTLQSTISLQHEDAVIGYVKRHHYFSQISVIDVPIDAQEAVICALLHLYTFKQT